MKIMASSFITSWQTDVENVKMVADFIFLGFKSMWMVTVATKSKDPWLLGNFMF